MDVIMWLLPVCITLFVIGWHAWHGWKNGLFLSALELGATFLSAFAAFFLTRLLINPEKVDLFGLGQKLVDKLPEGFLSAAPHYAPFLRALPTAILALVAFSLFFELLRFLSCKLLETLNKKYLWSERFWNFRASSTIALGVGILTALVCIVTDLVLLTGTVPFAANVMDCADAAFDDEAVTATAHAMHELEDSPVFHFCDALGCRSIYCELTSARRNGEKFSVGQELLDLSDALSKASPIFAVLPTNDAPPTPEQLRALPEALGDTPEVMTLMTDMLHANATAIGESDAVQVLSTALDVSPQAIQQYLGTVTAENAQEDLTTFCNIAALLAERDLLSASGEEVSLESFRDQQLRSQIKAELMHNPRLAASLLP